MTGVAGTARILDFQPASRQPAIEPYVDVIYVCPDLGQAIRTAIELRPWRIRVYHADAIKEIDRVLETSGARVVLAGGKLPDGDWRVVLRRMANRGALLSTIVLLGEFDGQQWIDALQHGAFDVLVEPVAPRELARVVRRASRWTAGRLRAPILITEPSSSKRRKSVGLRTLWDRLHRRANGNG